MTTDPPLARLILGSLRLYKVLISPLFAGSCRYLPSCSDYMGEAVHRHGPAAGLVLGLKRLARCHPWGGSGLDPVPDRHPWKRGTGPGFGTRDSGFEADRPGRSALRGDPEVGPGLGAVPGVSRESGKPGQANPESRTPNPGMYLVS